MAALAAAIAAPPEPAGPLAGWARTIRLTRPSTWPVAPALLVPPGQRVPSRRMLAVAGACAVAIVGGVAATLVPRGPVEPPVATWRALGQQQFERVGAGVVEEVIEGPRVPAVPRPVTLAPEQPAAPPPLRTVVAVTPEADEARPPERRAPVAQQRTAMSGTSHAKGADKRGARKGGTNAHERAVAAAAHPVPGPREACGDRSFFSMAICVNRQCESPRFMQHPYCVDLRRQWAERRLRIEQGRG
jgi:hypothetical protein